MVDCQVDSRVRNGISMKSTAFSGRYMTVASINEFHGIERITIPTLSAYAVEFSEFTPTPHLDTGRTSLYQDTDYQIAGDNVIFKNSFQSAFGGLESCRLVIHYHGIRDYGLLFPQIDDPALQERLGRLYGEADVAFDNCAWLSFALMAAAVYEGLLGWRLQKPKDHFHALIRCSEKLGVVSPHDAKILNDARANRNLVHPSRCTEGWITCTSAMDMRTVMDKLISRP